MEKRLVQYRHMGFLQEEDKKAALPQGCDILSSKGI